jgi:hypothetical protein
MGCPFSIADHPQKQDSTQMTDTVVGPKSPNSWDVSTEGDYQTIGEIKLEGVRFTIDPTPGSILVGGCAHQRYLSDAQSLWQARTRRRTLP